MGRSGRSCLSSAASKTSLKAMPPAYKNTEEKTSKTKPPKVFVESVQELSVMAIAAPAAISVAAVIRLAGRINNKWGFRFNAIRLLQSLYQFLDFALPVIRYSRHTWHFDQPAVLLSVFPDPADRWVQTNLQHFEK